MSEQQDDYYLMEAAAQSIERLRAKVDKLERELKNRDCTISALVLQMGGQARVQMADLYPYSGNEQIKLETWKCDPTNEILLRATRPPNPEGRTE